MIEQKYINTAIDYKKNVAGKFVLVEGAKLKQRIDGQRFAVTRKIDGHMQVVFYLITMCLCSMQVASRKQNS